jgi:uncharacterized delta-60 repeat protein
MKSFSFMRFSVKLQVLLLFLSGILTVWGAPGDLDPSFNPAAFGTNNGTVSVVKKQPDGKILIGGTFTDVNGQATTAVARFNSDGTIDTSFSSPDFGNGTGVGGAILAIGIQSDGKIVVGGDIFGVNGVFNKKMYRLNPNGSLDNTFQCPTFDAFTGSGIVNDIEIQADDKIVAGGDFGITVGGAANKFVRLNANGTVDGTFASFTTVGTIYAIEIQPDGKILTAGASTLVRRNADGSSDGTFSGVTNSSGNFFALKLTPDGKIYLGGQFTSLNGFTVRNLAKINTDGSIDLSFNQNGVGANDLVTDIRIAADSKVIISGYFTTYNTTARQKVARLNTDGTLDTSFVNNPQFSTLYPKGAEFLADGKILLGGGIQPGTTPPLVRLNTDGSWDTSVNYIVARSGKVREILQQPDGKILIAGQFSAVSGIKRNSLARLNADGTVDTSFVPYFNNTDAQAFNALALQPDGKIIVAGSSSIFLKRLNTDGSQDATFSPTLSGSGINDLKVLSNGQILVGGDLFTSVAKKIVRLNSNGTFDALFGIDQPNSSVYDMDVQPDGKIIIGGSFQLIGSTVRGRIARLTGEGALDPTFNPPGGANGDVYNVELQPDGKVILAGAFTGLNGSSNQIRIGRLNADGTLDTSFVQATDGFIIGLKIQPDGKILIGGVFSVVGGTTKIGIARLNANGTLDNTFNAIVPIGVVDIQLQTDGKILIGGDFVKVNGVSKLRIARLLNTTVPPRTLFDYDGDGKADVSVFRPSENKWYILQSSNAQTVQTVFAVPGDVPVPADYDGDGKTDVAVFRPANGDWWYLSSINNAQVNVHWGQSGDIPRPSDFDGDGKADFIVYRPSNSVWYRYGSTGATSILAFGIAEDKPLIGDFDGDGKSDVAIFRPSTGDWWYASSINGQFVAVHWGQSGDIPAPADFDGDGKTDFAVFRPSNGGWYIQNSSNGSFTILQFGLAEDKPVPADYDGDGKADIAVFRPSTGTWYLMQTTAGFGALQFGISTDVPTENAFLQ